MALLSTSPAHRVQRRGPRTWRRPKQRAAAAPIASGSRTWSGVRRKPPWVYWSSFKIMPNFIRRLFGLAGIAACLMAADPAWKIKPAAQWTEEDAKQFLAKSAWSQEIRGTITRRLTEDQLREAGQMGQPRGIGYDHVDPKGSGPEVSPNVFTGRGGDDRGSRAVPGDYAEVAVGERFACQARGAEIEGDRATHIGGRRLPDCRLRHSRRRFQRRSETVGRSA